MYLERSIDRYLCEWSKDRLHKPLLLRGVRQCGKTSAVRHLAGQFTSFAEINLEKSYELHNAFSGDYDIKRIISRLELECGVRIVPGETLLFIDEIQECPKALTALRYMYEEMPELHVIAAGSLLEFVSNNSKKGVAIDFPVGRVRSIYMYPMSFAEFLRGIGQEMLYERLLSRDWSTEIESAHSKLIELYKTFLIVGGMPEAVAEYVKTDSLLACQRIHVDIMTSFMDDFGKYSGTISSDVIRRVFEYCIHNVCSQTKSSSAIEGVSAYIFDECIKLLNRSGLVHSVKASSCESLPLGATEKETNKKLLVFDTGIYLTECQLNVNDILAADLFEQMNRGDVVEMQTGLELIKYSDCYRNSSLFYWYRSGANAELDYVIQRDNIILPMEVKASKKGSMQSMRSYLKRHPDTPYGIRVSLEKRHQYEDISVYPVYAVMHI